MGTETQAHRKAETLFRDTTVNVRYATIGDADAIASLLLDAFSEFKPQYTEAAFAATTPKANLIASRFSEGPTWVALAGLDIIGTVAAAPRSEALYVRSMAVLPSARGMNIGNLLLEHVEQYARAKHYTRLFLSTTPFLTAAIRLYEQSGFTRVQDGINNLFGTPIFTMEKQLR